MSRALLACLMVLGALALLAPAVALAGGSSAGDQQYIDPLAGTGHSHSHSSPASTTPTSTPSTTAGSTNASNSSSSTATTSSSSTATTSTAGSNDPSSSNKTLPMTGLDVPLAALTGVVMLASGALLRRIA